MFILPCLPVVEHWLHLLGFYFAGPTVFDRLVYLERLHCALANVGKIPARLFSIQGCNSLPGCIHGKPGGTSPGMMLGPSLSTSYYPSSHCGEPIQTRYDMVPTLTDISCTSRQWKMARVGSWIYGFLCQGRSWFSLMFLQWNAKRLGKLWHYSGIDWGPNWLHSNKEYMCSIHDLQAVAVTSSSLIAWHPIISQE